MSIRVFAYRVESVQSSIIDGNVTVISMRYGKASLDGDEVIRDVRSCPVIVDMIPKCFEFDLPASKCFLTPNTDILIYHNDDLVSKITTVNGVFVKTVEKKNAF